MIKYIFYAISIATIEIFLKQYNIYTYLFLLIIINIFFSFKIDNKARLLIICFIVTFVIPLLILIFMYLSLDIKHEVSILNSIEPYQLLQLTFPFLISYISLTFSKLIFKNLKISNSIADSLSPKNKE